ncbi:MAG TPA: hypothetical protein VOA78_06280 [Candidatus Dormibacteraeota bacterium]|nr:hypothetical protein [Candidatus Dormibacteraeota bacterium]
MMLLALRALIGVGLVSVVSLAVGSWIANCLSTSSFLRLDRLAVGLLGGFGLFSLILFIVGQFSFGLKAIVIAFCVAIVTSAPSILRFARTLSGTLSDLRTVPKIPLIIVGLVLVFTGVTGLAEVTGDWSNDTVAYHLLGPKVWLRNGVIRPVPDNSHTAFPQTAETMYGALLAIGGGRAPCFSSFVTFGMLLLITSSLAMRCGLDATGAWWVAALVATMPAVYSGSVNCFVDGIYAAFVLAAIRIGADAERNRDWAIFGIFCGLAMGTKYTGLLAFPIILLCIVWLRNGLQQKGWRENSTGILVAIGCACAIAAPYYLRNWIFLGCPIYPPPPGFGQVCSPKYLSPQAVAEFHAYIHERGGGLGRGFIAFVKLPFNLTYHTSNFHGAGGIGLAPLAFGPIGFIAARRNLLIRTLAVLSFFLLSIWFVTQQESRFLIHVYVIAEIVSVIGLRHVQLRGKSLPLVLPILLVATSLGYGLFMIGKGWPTGVKDVFSERYAEQAQKANIPFLQSFKFLNSSPEVKKVLILDRSVTPVYLDKDYIKPLGQWGELTLPGVSTPLEALKAAHELGVSHVLDVNSEVASFQIVGSRAGVTLVLEARNQRVYRID